jgi:hypothetical protein
MSDSDDSSQLLKRSVRTVKGFDTLLVIRHNTIPFEIAIYNKMTVADLEQQYKNDMVFLRNKNLQNSQNQLKGGIIWIPYLQKVVLILKARGTKAYVEVLYPIVKGEKCFVLSMLLQGFYLEQIHGKALVHQYFTEKSITKNGFIVPLVDDSNNIKMNSAGPDLAHVKQTLKIGETDAKELMKDCFVILNEQKLSNYNCDHFSVLYVYPKKQAHLRAVIKAKGGDKLFGIPFGKQANITIGTGR